LSRLDDALQRQIDLNQTRNVLHTRLGQTIEIDPEFLAVLEELCAKDGQAFSEAALQDAISFASKTLMKRMISINQFLQIDDEKTHDLENIYLHTWKRIIKTRDIPSTLRNHHYPALTRWMSGLYPEHFIEQLKSSPAIGHVVCEEYSAELQARLLGIDIQTFKQPLLDIGCGNSAGFVRYLRTFQKQAYGFDRRIENEESFLQQSNWLDYRFEPGAWGTIVSHMAFTNHFIHVFHHDKTQLNLYGRKFNEILGSLAAGGSFHYAPGLPFIEQGIDPEKYQVEQLVVIKGISTTRITRADAYRPDQI